MFFRKRKKDRNESDEEVQVDAFINLPTKTTITGDLRAERAVRIDCDFKGNVITTERVVISKEGQVEGNVKCSSALISGRVKGNIVALESLTLKVPAHIKGNILTKNIYIEPGVVIDGVYKIIEEKWYIVSSDRKIIGFCGLINHFTL